MKYTKFYIGGKWVDPVEPKTLDVINPATEAVLGHISVGSAADVDRAVKAARRGFESFSQTSREERVALFERILAGYAARYDDIAQAISQEMGAPMWLARGAQAEAGTALFGEMLKVLKDFAFEDNIGETRIRYEPIGVCSLITPWNWPINQIVSKVAPALAAGCAIVLKPSEIAPFDACILAEVMDAAGVPPGVFNLINGDGPGVGQPMASHPGVDMVSFTGSTRAGILVSKAAADTVKRVALELGGKSANIILADADLEKSVRNGVELCMDNAGQSCDAPTRMLVPEDRHAEALAYAKTAAETVVVGDPDVKYAIGPVVSEIQFDKVQGLIQKGIDEGAVLVTGGTGRPDGLQTGYYVKPTVFGNVDNDMTIAREEIFGPVLCILPYRDEDDAIRIANDTPYGLANYLSSGEADHAYRVASRLRSGMVHINAGQFDEGAPFGGYKQSGNGREKGVHGLMEFLEVKAICSGEGIRAITGS